MFAKDFNRYALPGDSISCEVEGFTFTATLYRDDCGDSPPDRDEGFWPSTDPESAGYIGPKSRAEFDTATQAAKAILQAWQNDEWFYCGISVSAARGDVQLVGDYSHALWGIECNYPGSDNSYLSEVANDLLGEALLDAKARLWALVESVKLSQSEEA